MLRNWWTLIGPLTSLTLLIAGCPDNDNPGCVPAEPRECRGAGDCSGEQLCNASGFGWGDCMCRPPVTATPGPGGNNGPGLGCTPGATRTCTGSVNNCTGVASCDSSGTFGPCICPQVPTGVSGSRPNVLAAPCARTADCGTSLRCWDEDVGLSGVFGAPSGGYCTSFCISAADCAVFDATAACVRSGGASPGFCIAGCLAQPPTADPAFCQDRPDAGAASGDAG